MKQIKIGNADEYVKLNLWCPWCDTIDEYRCKKFDQPICNKCGRFVPKRRYL